MVRSIMMSAVLEAAARALSLIFFMVLARAAAQETFADVRWLASIGLLGSALGVPALNAWSASDGLVADSAEGHGLLGSWLLATAIGSAVGTIAALPAGHGFLPLMVTLGVGLNYLAVVSARAKLDLFSLGWASVGGNMLQLLMLVAFSVTLTGGIPTILAVAIYVAGFAVPALVLPRVRRTFMDAWRGAGNALRQRLHLQSPIVQGLALQHGAHVVAVNLDLVILGFTAEAHELALFAVARSLAVLPLVPINASFHMALRTAADRHAPPGQALRMITLAIAGSVVVTIPLVLFPESVISGLYGKEFSSAGPAVMLTALGACVYAAAIMAGALLVAKGDARAFGAGVLVASATASTVLMLAGRFQNARGAALLSLAMSVAVLVFVIARYRQVQMIEKTPN